MSTVSDDLIAPVTVEEHAAFDLEEISDLIPEEDISLECRHGHYEPFNGTGCQVCLKAHWERQLSKSGLALSQLNRNVETAGATACPVCLSISHYERSAGKVECADCGQVYEWKASRNESPEVERKL